MENLVDLKPIADVINTLIEKLSNACGWIVARQTPERIAVDTLISDIQKSNLDPVNKAVLISQAKKIIREQTNQKAVLDNALTSLKETAAPEKIDPDWLGQFGDKVRFVSDETFRFIWGKILAQECNEPDSIPKSLLHILEQMDKEDAECFTKLCEYTMKAYDAKGNLIDYFPIIIQKKDEKAYLYGINYEKLTNLHALGLINFQSGGISVFTSTIRTFRYGEEEYNLPDDVELLNIGEVSYTKPGLALCRSVNVELHKDFLREDCIPYWEEAIKQRKEWARFEKDVK